MLCEPLQVLALKFGLHKLDLCERKAIPDRKLLVHLTQTAAAFCLLLCWKTWILGKTAGLVWRQMWPSQGIVFYKPCWPHSP